ncbi:MAG: DNA (cytosine-5-)-methyltransferase [Prevotella sp.]|nr:DNA (cytosine-5-)-methyltransferase [Prevotella sp.]
MSEHRFNHIWKLADGYPAPGITKHDCTVFGCFVCGGGSTMGYKLAGYHHLGGVEIDESIATIYKENHHPENFFTMDVRDFNEKTDLPSELYNLDLLDGSPPCTTFSMAGDREKSWGKTKQFKEGQKHQRLDDLVFVYCDTIKKLKPKVCLLENVAGLVQGNGKAYAKQIIKYLADEYKVQVFLLNASTMGVPQNRERCFIIGLREDFDLPKLKLDFHEKPIFFSEIKDCQGRPITGEKTLLAWNNRRKSDRCIGDTNKRIKGKQSNFNCRYAHDDRVLDTITSSCQMVLYSQPLNMSETEQLKGTTFPIDYKAPKSKVQFLTGMSVPPIMTAQIAWQIYLQWLSKIKGD